MEFKKYKNIKEFADENLELLLEKEWLNCLMVGNCLDGLENGVQDWILAKITKACNTELIMLYRKPYSLIMYSPTNNTSDDLYKFAAEQIYKIDNNLLGVNTEKEIANKFAKYYCDIANKTPKLETPMRILVLKELEKGNLIENVNFRTAKRIEENILLQFIKEFHKEALGKEIEDKFAQEKLDNYFKKGCFVLEVDGRIVSQAVFARNLKKGKSISGVYTPKDLRGKGYAYNLVYRLSEKSLKEGAEYCVLYTDDKNPISNHIYGKIGYKRMVDCEDILFI